MHKTVKPVPLPVFLPPAIPALRRDVDEGGEEFYFEERTPRHSASDKQIKFTKGAEQAMERMGFTLSQVRQAIEEPDEIEQDSTRNDRTHLRRGKLSVLITRDGTVLAVHRR